MRTAEVKWVFGLCLLLAGCRCSDGAARMQWYRVTLQSETDEVPFFLGLEGKDKAIIANGPERLEALAVRTGSKIRVEFPIFGTWIDLEPRGDGAFSGTRGGTLSGQDPAQTVVAVPVDGPDPMLRFEAVEQPAHTSSSARFEFGGAWRIRFRDETDGIARFSQDARGLVDGTLLLHGFGDLRYLTGRSDGPELRLSTFDGQHAYLIQFRGGPGNDRMIGEWIDADGWTGGQISAVRDEKTSVDLFGQSRGRERRKMVMPALEEPPFRGKPVIVDVFGTWCPACLDATPFLVDVYREHHARGLEMLSLAYEFRSKEENRRYVDRFIARYGVSWKVIIFDTNAEKALEILPPELADETHAWPTAIFLDANHEIRAIHSGFAGPAAGEAHARLKAEWRKLASEIEGG